MDEKVKSRSGIFISVNGEYEFWWNGQHYGCVLPEELMDAMLVASKSKEDKGEKNNGNKTNI